LHGLGERAIEKKRKSRGKVVKKKGENESQSGRPVEIAKPQEGKLRGSSSGGGRFTWERTKRIESGESIIKEREPCKKKRGFSDAPWDNHSKRAFARNIGKKKTRGGAPSRRLSGCGGGGGKKKRTGKVKKNDCSGRGKRHPRPGTRKGEFRPVLWPKG